MTGDNEHDVRTPHTSALDQRTDSCLCGAVVAPVSVVVQAPYPTRYHYEHCGPAWWNEDAS
jgi:hypothetical protein